MSAREQSLSEGYALERQRFIELWQDDNQFEGVSAFLEKSRPVARQDKGVSAVSNSEQIVAFIGLGNMGAPMVANLCSKGFAVRAYDVSAEALQKLSQRVVWPRTVR